MCQFCGKLTLGWAESQGTLDRCYRAGLEEYCACDVFMRTQCNSGNSVTISLVMMMMVFSALCSVILL